jgi:hypothetical protein
VTNACSVPRHGAAAGPAPSPSVRRLPDPYNRWLLPDCCRSRQRHAEPCAAQRRQGRPYLASALREWSGCAKWTNLRESHHGQTSQLRNETTANE